jgi:hypothetical protein
MLLWILVFIVFMVLFTLGYRFAVIRLSRRLARDVDTHHREVQHILSTRTPPPEWRTSVKEAEPRTPEDSRRRLTSRLDKLIGYFQRSPVVSDEESRREIVGSLEEVKEEWESSRIEDLLSSADSSSDDANPKE